MAISTSQNPMTLQQATTRVANLLQRGSELDTEIMQWLNFVQREITDRIDFPEMRKQQIITLVGGWNIYAVNNDLSHVSSIHYTDQTLYPSRGWNLTPFPRSFYKGDTVDFEKVENRSVPAMGDPLFYFVDFSSAGLANASDGTFGQSYTNITGTVTIGSNIVTGILPSTAGLNVGNVITGAGIPTGTTITSIDSSTQIHISNNATISQANEGMSSAPAIGTPGGPVTAPAIITYPAFIYTKKGQIEINYYRLPVDVINPTDTFDINPRWNHYLIWLAYYYGMTYAEKDNVQLVAMSASKYEDLIGQLRLRVQQQEDRTLVLDLPVYGGLEAADSKY